MDKYKCAVCHGSGSVHSHRPWIAPNTSQLDTAEFLNHLYDRIRILCREPEDKVLIFVGMSKYSMIEKIAESNGMKTDPTRQQSITEFCGHEIIQVLHKPHFFKVAKL